jgi:PAS domain S-box-containing protein
MRYDMHMDYSGSFPVIYKKYGPVFYIHALYSHSLNILAWILLIRAVFFKNTVYRKQAVSLLVGMSLIVVPNVLYISGLGPVKRFDITPVFFGPAGVIITLGIFRYRLFDLVPVARAAVIENMDAGVMVLDMQNRVLDMNPAFRKITDYNIRDIDGIKVEEVCKEVPALLKSCTDGDIAHSEFVINKDGMPMIYEAFISTLNDNRGVPSGRLILVYDITQKKQEQQRYMEQQWKLAVTEERERLARDLHDDLGQVLGFINLQAQGIRKELANADIDIVSQKLDRLINVSQEAHNDIREYIRSIRSTEALGKDFMGGLLKDISSFEEQTGLKVKLDIPSGLAGDGLRPDIRINTLNIVREALNNIRKHSKADNVYIGLKVSKEQLCVTVEDDGKGFDIEADLTNRYGLSIMRERASEISAKIDIKSVPMKGCHISLAVPLDGEVK